MLTAAAVVTLGYLVTPGAVPIYDGVSQPDEPYRYVIAPAGVKVGGTPTGAVGRSAVAGGISTSGLSLGTAETGPQFSAYLPNGALAAAGGTVQVKVTPKAPTDPPPGALIDGNVYQVTFVAPGGPVTLTKAAALASIYLRATTSRQPGPVMEHRAATGQPWTALGTSRAGQDAYASAFVGPGDYGLVFSSSRSSKSGPPVLTLLLGSGIALLAGVVLVIRRRTTRA